LITQEHNPAAAFDLLRIISGSNYAEERYSFLTTATFDAGN
jgi:hypothetical protein